MTRRTLLRFLATEEARQPDPIPVSRITERDFMQIAGKLLEQQLRE